MILRRRPVTAALVSLAACTVLLSSASGQGSLTPPAGPPAPVFKTLDQVESRTPVSSLSGDATAVHVIRIPGSYYLTGTVTGNTAKAGIRIEAVNVTLDLNGFTIDAVVGSTAGISSNAPGGFLTIRNGSIRSFTTGIDISNATNFLLQDLQIITPQGTGVNLDGQGIADRVTVSNGKSYGINATATSFVRLNDCRVDGITATATVAGIRAPQGDLRNCTVQNITGTIAAASQVDGILADGLVDSCTVRSLNVSVPANVTGIRGGSVTRSQVSNITNNTGTARGVAEARIASGTSVNALNGGSLAMGIHAVPLVEGCRITNVISQDTASGASGCMDVTRSSVSVINGPTNSYGIFVPEGGKATGNVVTQFGDFGVYLNNNSVAENNRISNNSSFGFGIYIIPAGTGIRIEQNSISHVQNGVYAASSKSVIVRNSVFGISGSPYSVPAYVVTAPYSAPGTNPNANIYE